MKQPGDFTPVLWGGVGSVVTAVGVWFTGLRYRYDKRKDQEAKEDKARVDRESVDQRASDKWSRLSDTLSSALSKQQDRNELLQKQIDDLRAEVVLMHDTLGRKDIQIAALTEQNASLLKQHEYDRGRIEQLEGELRQAKQIQSSIASIKAKSFDGDG